jgi:Kelch motif
MENKKLKLLFTGRKGILLKNVPESLDCLHGIIQHYYEVQIKDVQLTFLDTEKDECEILDENTYQTACAEFPNKIVININLYEAVLEPKISMSLVSHEKKSLKFFKKKSTSMAVFDIESETIEWVSFPLGILFKEYASWVELPSGEIFYSGGGHPISSTEVYLLNPYTRTYKILPEMLEARHSHGIAYSNGSIYIIGGIKNVFFAGAYIRNCEKYSLSTNKWEKIYDMDTGRGDVSAISINDQILIFGRGSNYLVEYDSKEFIIDLKEDQGGCMCLVDSLLYIFQGSKVKVCDLNTQQIIEQHKLPRKGSWWSHCPPVAHMDFIYFVWWEEPGWICRYNRITKDFRKIISL